MSVLPGKHWWEMAFSIPELVDDPIHRGFILSGPSEAMSLLDSDVAQTIVTARYVAVGDPYLTCIGACAVEEREVLALEMLNDWNAAFRHVHQLIKRRPCT